MTYEENFDDIENEDEEDDEEDDYIGDLLSNMFKGLHDVIANNAIYFKNIDNYNKAKLSIQKIYNIIRCDYEDVTCEVHYDKLTGTDLIVTFTSSGINIHNTSEFAYYLTMANTADITVHKNKVELGLIFYDVRIMKSI